MRFAALAALVVTASAASAQVGEGVQGPPLEFETTADGFRASGRWQRVEGTAGKPHLAGVDVAEVRCHRDLGACFEAVTLRSTGANGAPPAGLLIPLLLRYSVERWTDAEVSAVGRTPGAEITIQIDLAGRRVTRAHRGLSARPAPVDDAPGTEVWVLQ